MKIKFFFSVTTLAVRTSLTQIRKRVGNKNLHTSADGATLNVEQNLVAYFCRLW